MNNQPPPDAAPTAPTAAQWKTWLSGMHDPHISPPKVGWEYIRKRARKYGAPLDAELFTFVTDPAASSLTMGPLHAQTGQIWLETRAEQLGLPFIKTPTASEPPGGDATRHTVLSKPPGWTLDMAKAAESKRGKNAVKSAKKADKESRRQEAMSHWSASCGKCEAELDAWTAMYCKGRWGPYCQDCIENDDEMSGYSWDPKEVYWDL